MEGRKGMGPVRKNLWGKCYPIFMGIPYVQLTVQVILLADLKIMAGYIMVIDYVWMGSCVCKNSCFMQESLFYARAVALCKSGCFMQV